MMSLFYFKIMMSSFQVTSPSPPPPFGESLVYYYWQTVERVLLSYGCTREVANHERSVRVATGIAKSDSSFLSA